MCLSTAYYSEKAENNIIVRYVAEIDVVGDIVTLRDIMGAVYPIQGTLRHVDLTGGTVIIDPSDQ